MKRLITDRDVSSGAVSGPIVLDGSTILTPAARDRALRMGLAIVEAGAGGAWHALAPSAAAAAGCSRCSSATCTGGCAACPNAAPGTCARCGSSSCSCAGGAGVAGLQLAAGGGHAATLGTLADGLYLVRVQGGRAQVLPATGPGLMQRARGSG